MQSRCRKIVFISILTIFCSSFSAFAQMTSTNFQIVWDEFNSGGGETSSSASYELRDSVSGSASTRTEGTAYDLDAGYRASIYDRVADFEIFMQDRSSQVAATLLAGQVVTVTTTSGFSVGQMIALISNEGGSQIEAIGKITNIDTILNKITTDAWQVGAGGAPSIDGSNDYVYALDSSSISLGTLSTSIVATALVAWEVSAEVSDGYSVYIYEDQGLTNGTDTITDVSDGTVTAGVSEYGARSSDTSLSSTFDTQDTAITTTLEQVGSRSDVSFDSRDFLTLKTAISGLESAGSYSHTLTLIYVGDY
ncbi:hypothetical protein KJ673_03705 [Patescibacteria group bacterium]|nr:hypothetical protein [Patescibacteria group bacterium]